MSAEATFWAWSMGIRSSSAKLVLLCLADCHNSDTERCDPSIPFITQFTGLDKKTVPAAINWLQRAGLVSATPRTGSSTQYTLHIDQFPVPAREKGKRRQTVAVKTPPKNGGTQKRGDPKIGGTQNSPPTPPNSGGSPPPKTGAEPTKNLQGETYKDQNPAGSAAGAASPVDNSMAVLKGEYLSASPAELIFNRGAQWLGEYGIPDDQARSFLGMCKTENGTGKTLDALVTAIMARPEGCPKAYILTCLTNTQKPLNLDWNPPDALVAELQQLGIPDFIIHQARDIFVTWFCELGIPHHDFPGQFRRWCLADWEYCENQAHLYRQRLAASAGVDYQRPVQFPQ